MDKDLITEWIFFKHLEKHAAGMRREIEHELAREMGLPKSFEGTVSDTLHGYKVIATGRINRKVDASKAQEIAAELGLTEHLSDLFRWKPEINMKEWKSADESITLPLTDAITATPSNPSFKIEEM